MPVLAEIKRRKIVQVAAVYAVTAWLLVQVAVAVEGPLSLPAWVDTLVIVLLAIGFPVTLIVSWAFNVTSEGLVRDEGVAPSGRSSPRTIEYVLLGLVLAAVGWLIYRVEFEVTGSEPLEPAIMSNSIAILPCDNLSPNPENAYFAAGLHEEMLNRLAKIRDLNVIARTSVLQYADVARPITEIARELRVGTVMECSVSYAEDRVAVTTQLIDGQAGVHLWSERYNRALVDVFGIQTDIALNIADALEAELLPSERDNIQRPPTDSTEAYSWYLRALSVVDLITSYTADAERAELHRYLDLAVDADPNFALAYATKALEYAAAMWGASDQEFLRLQSQALENAEAALRLDPETGIAYAARAYVHSLNERAAEAEQAINRARQLDPNNPLVLNFVVSIYENMGRTADALAAARRLAEVSPVGGLLTLSHVYWGSGRFEEAIQPLLSEISINASDAHLHHDLGVIAAILGNETEALERLRIAETLWEEDPPVAADIEYVMYGYSRLGRGDDVLRLDERLRAEIAAGQTNTVRVYRLLSLGRYDELLEWMNRIASGGGPPIVRVPFLNVIINNTIRDPVLERPEFREARRRLGFQR